MVERKTVYSDPEAFVEDKLQPDGFGEMVGLLEGDPFTRNFRVDTVTGNTLELHSERQVLIAVMTDADGNMYCEPFDPEMHGEQRDLTIMGIEEFENNPDFFDAQESLAQVRKAGASKQRFNIEDKWRADGGDPSFKMPKTIYQKGKLR